MVELSRKERLDALVEGRKSAGESTIIATGLAANFAMDAAKYKNFVKLGEEISKDNSISAERQVQFLKALGAKSVSSPDLLANLDRDLERNPKLAAQLLNSMKQADATATITAVKNYTPGNLSTSLPALPIEKPAAAAPQENNQEKKSGKPDKPNQQKAPVAVAVTPVQPKPPRENSDKSESAPAVTTQSAPADTNIIDKKPDNQNSDASVIAAVVDGLVSASDEDIKTIIQPNLTKELANGLANKASSLGVNTATTDAFKQRIASDPKLVADIAKNFQNNPEFVRQLAKLSQNNEELKEPMKSKAREEMNKLMNNPELLASEEHVQRLQKQMKAAEDFKKSGFGAMFDGVMGFFKGIFQGLVEQFQRIFAGFTGPNKVLSMSTSGSSILPIFLIHQNEIAENQRIAEAEAQYSPSQMTAFAPKENGKYFHDGAPIMEGGKQKIDEKTKKPVFEQVPNGQISVKDSEGNDVKVIPSIGSLMAKQAKGEYENGAFKPGNIRVPMVVAINENGEASKLKWISMTPEAFADYKQKADAAAKANNHSFKELAFQPYTEQDARKAGIMPTATIIPIDQKTGSVGEAVEHKLDNAVQEPGLQKSGAETFRVRDPRNPSANDMDYKLQG